jgi:hypothetical protein
VEVQAIATLERSMARVRRSSRAGADPPAGSVVLAGCCELLELPAGTLDFATCLREALDRARPLPARPALRTEVGERLLIRSRAPVPPARLREVEVEALSPALGHFLCALRSPLSQPARAALAAKLDASPAELDALTRELAEAGILLIGPGSAR